MKIANTIVVLDHSNDGPPVFDVSIQPIEPGKPAPFRMAWPRMERGAIVARQQTAKLVTCILFSIDPDLPPETRRLAVLAQGGTIPDELAPHATYLGSYVHPNGHPVSIYEFPMDDALLGEVTPAGPDILAALENTQPQTQGETP